MIKIICDKCGKEIKENEQKYIFATCKSKPNLDGSLPPSEWQMVKEVCMNCCLELEQSFNNFK